MSLKQETKAVINPKTNRPVKIGSKIWLKLVKEGILEGEYKDPNVLGEIKEDEDAQETIEKINETLPSNEQGVRGRGKYAVQIVKRSKQPSIMDTAKHTAKKAASVISNPDVYNELQESNNFEYELEQLILAELTGSNPSLFPTEIKTTPAKKTSMLKKPCYQMVEQPVEIESEYEEDEN